MAIDQGPVIQSAVLRSELVRLRKESGMTQEQVAGNLEWSASKLIRVKGGRSSITKVDLDALLTQYGVTSESQRERLQALNRGARQAGWWESYRNDAPAPYLDYVGYEAGAAFIRQFPGSVVPGLLQTPSTPRHSPPSRSLRPGLPLWSNCGCSDRPNWPSGQACRASSTCWTRLYSAGT